MVKKKDAYPLRDPRLVFPMQTYEDASTLMTLSTRLTALRFYRKHVQMFNLQTLIIDELSAEDQRQLAVSVVNAGDVMLQALRYRLRYLEGDCFSTKENDATGSFKTLDDGCLTWSRLVAVGPYAYQLAKYVSSMEYASLETSFPNPWKMLWMDEEGNLLSEIENASQMLSAKIICDLGAFSESQLGDGLPYQIISDELIGLHLSGMRNISLDGKEARYFDCALTEMWLRILERMRNSTIGLCDACGRPYLAQPARGGKPRKFCSDECRIWRHQNPDTPRRRLRTID